MTAIGRRHHLIVHCPDPLASARFWSAVLGAAGQPRLTGADGGVRPRR